MLELSDKQEVIKILDEQWKLAKQKIFKIIENRDLPKEAITLSSFYYLNQMVRDAEQGKSFVREFITSINIEGSAT